jgi:hypothetical protein
VIFQTHPATIRHQNSKQQQAVKKIHEKGPKDNRRSLVPEAATVILPASKPAIRPSPRFQI